MMLKSWSWITAIVLVVTSASLAQNNEINLRHTVVVDVVQKTKDAVVNISADSVVQRRVNGNPFFQEPSHIFERQITSLGSGFIVQRDGYVVTNNHVIDRARTIHVELADGRKLLAELIGADPDADLAVLRIHSSKQLPTIELGDSSDLMIGEPAIAVGDPFGYSHSVSTGIVSALHRDLRDPRESLNDLIQTDAAINLGNSGGPLLNAYGQVIGINTAVQNYAQNIGFAIPINRLRDLIPTLMNPAISARVEVPVKFTERRSITPPANINVEVMDGDSVLRSIDGKPVHDLVDAYALMLQTQPGQKVEIVTDHGRQSLLAQRATSAFNPIASAREKLGIDVQALTPEIADQLGVPTDSGVLIAQVLAGSPAALAAAQAGDVIFLLGTAPVHGMDSFGVALRHLPESGRVRVGIIRGNQLEYGFLRL
jgi:serine protease Do